MSQPPIVDPAAIADLRALNPEDGDSFLREIIAIYLEDSPKRLHDLDQTLVANDRAAFVRAAHSLKGSSANLGITTVKAVAEKLEHDGRSAELPSLRPAIEELKSAFASARVELEKLAGA